MVKSLLQILYAIQVYTMTSGYFWSTLIVKDNSDVAEDFLRFYN